MKTGWGVEKVLSLAHVVSARVSACHLNHLAASLQYTHTVCVQAEAAPPCQVSCFCADVSRRGEEL
jgi:hypothetical protein